MKYLSGQKLNRYLLSRMGPEVGGLAVAIGSYFCRPAYAVCYAAGNYDLARANGASANQALRIAAISGVSAYAANGIGTYTQGMSGATRIATSTALHGIRGGVTNAALGGDFRSGFVGGAFGAFGDTTGLSGGVVGAAIMGGIGAKLTGGKFADGALQAVVGRMFNHCFHGVCDFKGYSLRKEWEGFANVYKQIQAALYIGGRTAVSVQVGYANTVGGEIGGEVNLLGQTYTYTEAAFGYGAKASMALQYEIYREGGGILGEYQKISDCYIVACVNLIYTKKGDVSIFGSVGFPLRTETAMTWGSKKEWR